jgi:hypothetical protein
VACRAGGPDQQAAQSGGSSKGPKQPKRGRGWWQRLASALQQQQPLKLALNALLFFFLLRLWPMGARPGFGSADSLVLPVAFSEFIKSVKKDDVRSITMEGATISYALRPSSRLLAKPPQGVDASRLSFSTTRPADYAVPYELLERNGVPYSAVAKGGGGGLGTVLVYALYAGLLLSAFGRLPLRLPTKGAGRRHKSGEEGGVSFDDVAGVDEAKEELAEIVVRARGGRAVRSACLLLLPPTVGCYRWRTAARGCRGPARPPPPPPPPPCPPRAVCPCRPARAPAAPRPAPPARPPAGLPARAGALLQAGREAAQRRAAGGPPRHRQDAAGARRGGRGGRALLLHQRLGVCRAVSGRRAAPGG